MTSVFPAGQSTARSALRLVGVTFLCLGCLGAAVTCGRVDEPSDDAGQVSFKPEERICIDDGCLWCPREKRNVSRVEAYGNALNWLVTRTPLPVEEEIRRATAKDEELQPKAKKSVPPAAAERVFRNLVETLPPRMRPKEYEFKLTVVDPSEAEAFSLGAGRVYVAARALRLMPPDDRTGHDQLSFVLAHELGHLCLGHARRVYQRLWVNEHLQRDVEANRKKPAGAARPATGEIERSAEQNAEDERIKAAFASLAGVGTFLEQVYSREEQFQADLFAIHLCRNAGCDLETCLDALRRKAIREDGTLLAPHPPREGNPPVEPEVQPRTTGEVLTLANHPSAAQRLRRLRLELDGLVYAEPFGMFEFDPRTKSVKRAADRSVPDDTRVVVCIHGMESSLRIYLPLMNRMASDPAAMRFRILGFQYPNDESLARSGKFLKREMQRVCASSKNVDFVCHSAGGLVFRQYAEVEGGDFHHVYFLGTPHYGSDLAALRSLLEATQFIGDLKLGYDTALQQAILDGHGQMSHDLQPDSLFLRQLNAPRDNLSRDRYTIYRGQASSRTRVLLMKAGVEAGRKSLERLLKTDEATLSKFARAGLEKLVIPAEIANGDMAVTLESAKLAGVDDVYTHPLHHTELPRHAEIIEHVVKQLVAEE